MQKRTIITVSILAGVVLLGGTAAIAGPIVYRDLIVGEADGGADGHGRAEPDRRGEHIDPAALSGTWTVADGSFAGYRVDEVLNDTDVTVVGRTEEVTGTLTVEDLTLTAADLTVDVASITTDSTSRDDVLPRQRAARRPRTPRRRSPSPAR